MSAPLTRQFSSPYGEFLAEKEEILRFKWLESEKAQHDIGFERALNDWARNHRSQWRRERNEALRSKQRR